MEHLKGNVSSLHLVDKVGTGFFIVVGGKGGSKPETECVGGRKGRFACQIGIVGYNVRHGFAAEHEILESFTLNGKRNL